MYLYSNEYINLVIQKNLWEAKRLLRLFGKTSADILKLQAVLRILSDTVLGGSTTFCGLGESTEPPASTAFGR